VTVEARSPSKRDVGATAKAREWLGYVRKHRRYAGAGDDVPMFLGDVAEYDALLREHAARGLAGATVLEIGFGTRAERLAILSAAGAAPTGVDMEVPMLRLNLATMREIQRRNGSERLAKSTARHLLFDREAKKRLRRGIASRYGTEKLDYGRIVVGDAADLDLEPDSLDLVTSEDVFEHMTVESLSRTLAMVRRSLKPSGLALIRPNVFTGISGGHLAEWYQPFVLDDPDAERRSEPWEHLRGRRFEPNTFLNELTRADYRRHFVAAGFEIVEERVRHPELGASLMTPALREELSRWPDEELFSNQVMFVLRPRAAA
jgi:ubiquinone/menaquinone biosynthesis C-methylase UbiE